MLAMACGMQNAMTTRYSGAVVRTTHLTGMFTDMGLLIGHMLRSDKDFQDMWKFSLFIPIILGKLMPSCYSDFNHSFMDECHEISCFVP
jgi:uncharacterized membrane protein YoaK (UPF0700 family)